MLLILIAFLLVMLPSIAHADPPSNFKHVPLQYIVALADPSAKAGHGAEQWGLWHQDPGPRGCLLDSYDQLKASGGIAPAQWKFDSQDWWLEEHGVIMEKPSFPLPAGKYVVTGGREVTSILTVDKPDNNGDQRWELGQGATLHDVTHLPCHAARYTPDGAKDACLPTQAEKQNFPVAAGVAMPSIKGCQKKEYAVLFVIGIASDH